MTSHLMHTEPKPLLTHLRRERLLLRHIHDGEPLSTLLAEAGMGASRVAETG
jgi:hypothetical protein